MKKHIKRGEIYLADLNPYQGSEQGGIRPVLILQNDTGNLYSHTTIIASLTTHIYKKGHLPTHVFISDREDLEHNSIIMCEQIRTLKTILCCIYHMDKELIVFRLLIYVFYNYCFINDSYI